MRIWLMLLMLTAAALGGCADEGAEPTDEDDAGDAQGNDGSGGSGGDDGNDDGNDGQGDDDGADGNDTNTPPTAGLAADVVNGTAPLNVTFTIDGSDADGDNITWILTIDGNDTAQGDAFPATYNHTFGIGAFLVQVSVSDGIDAASANVTINAAQAPDTGPCGGEPEPCVVAEELWVTVWSDGRCDAKHTVTPSDSPALYWHDRHNDGNPPGTAFVLGGGGSWVYEESNGIPGMQLTQELSALDEADPLAKDWDCQNGDTIIF